MTTTANEDDDGFDNTERFTLSAAGKGIIAADVVKVVNISDNDDTEFNLARTSASLNEGGQGSFGIRPNTRPSSNITVTLTPAKAGIGIDTDPNTAGHQNTLFFRRYGQIDAWDKHKTVSLIAFHDTDTADESFTISITGKGGDYEDKSATFTATIDDTGSKIHPAHQCATFTGATLNNACKHPVTARGYFTNNSGNCGTPTGTPSNRPITGVIPYGADSNGSATVQSSILPASACVTYNNPDRGSAARQRQIDSGYQDCSSAGITDCGAGGVTVHFPLPHPSGAIEVSPAGSLNIDEGESQDISVSLSAAPSANVSVSLAKTNADVSLSSATLTFTPSNHSTAQTVTVSAAEDSDAVNDTDTITLSASGAITASDVTRSVFITDDEVPTGTIEVTPAGTLAIDEGGSTGGSFQINLDSAPNADVTISLTKTNADVSLSPSSLTFAPSNYDTAQSVTVTSGEDDDASDDTDTITISASGGIIASSVTKSVSIADDDPTPGTIQFTAGTLSVDEGGSARFDISLSTAPKWDAVVTFSTTNADVTISPASLTFTPSNFSTAQSVTVTIAEDSDTVHESDTITVSASGGIDAPSVTKEVSIVENDQPAGTIQLTPAGTLIVNENSDNTLDISLSVAPNADVTVSLSKTDSDLSLAPTSLTFTPSNHSTAQSVTVAADDDAERRSPVLPMSGSPCKCTTLFCIKGDRLNFASAKRIISPAVIFAPAASAMSGNGQSILGASRSQRFEMRTASACSSGLIPSASSAMASKRAANG
ncbi:MAG: hypothetical protein ISN28_09060 [Ectothiorhodospiraceae bacterium AqS1]|nr:hypothetical protein [Ectothiorhodospiraceae bacterium AqS1]